MKYSVIILFILLSGCSHYLPSIQNAADNESSLIQVECNNEQKVVTSIVQALRLVRVNDLEKQDNGSSLLIKARYSSLPNYKAMQIKEDLQILPGIIDIQLIKDGTPVKNIN